MSIIYFGIFSTFKKIMSINLFIIIMTCLGFGAASDRPPFVPRPLERAAIRLAIEGETGQARGTCANPRRRRTTHADHHHHPNRRTCLHSAKFEVKQNKSRNHYSFGIRNNEMGNKLVSDRNSLTLRAHIEHNARRRSKFDKGGGCSRGRR